GRAAHRVARGKRRHLATARRRCALARGRLPRAHRSGRMKRVGAQAKIELLLTLRRGESLLVLAGIPVAILVFFASVHVLPHVGRPVDFLVPGVIALSVIASAMTSLGIATGFERHAGVLRRLGTTPLRRSGLFGAKVFALAVVVALQIALV